MGYGCKFPANELGKSKNLWVVREYGLYGVWVTRELTVDSNDYMALCRAHDRLMTAGVSHPI